jgi:hypothetical protein
MARARSRPDWYRHGYHGEGQLRTVYRQPDVRKQSKGKGFRRLRIRIAD